MSIVKYLPIKNVFTLLISYINITKHNETYCGPSETYVIRAMINILSNNYSSSHKFSQNYPHNTTIAKLSKQHVRPSSSPSRGLSTNLRYEYCVITV